MNATLPFFLPLPLFSPFGTLGAVIRIKSPFLSRKALFDTGVAGPLTSFCLSIPAVVIGLKLSEVIPKSHLKGGIFQLADPLLFSFVQRLVIGAVPENYEVVLHPIAFAGWVGLFVTALNLLPVGQLDGGHIVYGIFGKNSRRIFLATIAVMAFFFVFYCFAWFLPLLLMLFFGSRHPVPIEDQDLTDNKRKLIGGITFLAFLLSFTSAPFPEIPSLIELIDKGVSILLK